MYSLAPIRFEPHGPADTGLQAWETIDPNTLTVGEPVQRGHVYFCNETGALTAGVWDCTPMTGKLEPYAVNELMLILEGSVTLIDARGHVETLRAGESFVIPKGMPCIWKQTEYMRKYYVIFDDPSGSVASDTADLKVIRVDTACNLSPVHGQDPARYDGPVPAQHTQNFFTDLTTQMRVGLWDTVAMRTNPIVFPSNDFMHVLEGSITFTGVDADWCHTFTAGDSFFKPKGTHYRWICDGYVRKISCSFQAS